MLIKRMLSGGWSLGFGQALILGSVIIMLGSGAVGAVGSTELAGAIGSESEELQPGVRTLGEPPKHMSWFDVELADGEPSVIDLHRLMVADNLELAQQHPEDFASYHYNYFVLPVSVAKSSRPGSVQAWQEVNDILMSDEFDRAALGRNVLEEFKENSDDVYTNDLPGRVYTLSFRSRLADYDFQSKQFPISVSGIKKSKEVTRLKDFGETRLRLKDQSAVQVFTCPHSLTSTISSASGSKTATPPNVFSCEFETPKQIFSISVEEQKARQLLDHLGEFRKKLNWELRIRLGEIQIERRFRDGKGDEQIPFYRLEPIEAEVIAGRLTYTNENDQLVVLTSFGDFDEE